MNVLAIESRTYTYRIKKLQILSCIIIIIALFENLISTKKRIKIKWVKINIIKGTILTVTLQKV